jgi:hypothetical protein
MAINVDLLIGKIKPSIVSFWIHYHPTYHHCHLLDYDTMVNMPVTGYKTMVNRRRNGCKCMASKRMPGWFKIVSKHGNGSATMLATMFLDDDKNSKYGIINIHDDRENAKKLIW